MNENTDTQSLSRLRQGLPWQLLMIGDVLSQTTAEDVDVLTRIVDLLPYVGGPDATTSASSIQDQISQLQADQANKDSFIKAEMMGGAQNYMLVKEY